MFEQFTERLAQRVYALDHVFEGVVTALARV